MKPLEILRQIYENKKYYFLTTIITIISFVIFYKLMLAKITNHSLNIFMQMSGSNFTFFNLLGFLIISILFGIYISIIVYKFKLIKNINKKKGSVIGFTGYFGLIAGVFGAGCPTCGSVIFALFGAPLALMYFPLKGLEFQIFSIIILLISNYFLIKSLNKSCNLDKKFK